MIAPPPGVRVWLACGRTDMRKGMDGLAMLAQQVLNEDPFGGAVPHGQRLASRRAVRDSGVFFVAFRHFSSRSYTARLP